MQVSEFKHHLGANWGRNWLVCVAILLGVVPAWAQKYIVLTSSDVGKVITGTHFIQPKAQGFSIGFKHRVGDKRTWMLSLQKTQQFERSPFTLKTALPVTLAADGSVELEFGVDYSKSLQQDNIISFLAAPQGEVDVLNKGIAVNLKVSAQGELMFFVNKSNSYSKSIGTYEFVGPSDRLVEVAWNGGGATMCTIKIEDSGRDAFKLLPNSSGANPVGNGHQFNLSGGGAAFFVQYDGKATKGMADAARITFTESGGQSITFSMIGTYQGGTSLFAAARELLTKDNLKGGYRDPLASQANAGKSTIKDANKDPNAGKGAIKDAGKPKVDDGGKAQVSEPVVAVAKADTSVRRTPAPSTPSASVSARNPSVNLLSDSEGLITKAIAEERLRRYHQRYGGDNLVSVGTARFEKENGIYRSNVRITIPDSLRNDPAFSLHFIRVKYKAGGDSITINASENTKMFGDTTLQLALVPDEHKGILDADSFQLAAEFIPEYLSDDGIVTNDSLQFRGGAFGRAYRSNNWLIFLWIGLGALVVLFFVLGFVMARKAVSSLRYLRESRYQRDRHTANSNRQRVDVETIHIDLARRDTDLIQLAFNGRGEVLDERAKAGEKVRAIAATLPMPIRGGLTRFFAWLYGPFGRKREPRFKAIYYSLRVELPRNSIPQQMRLKDESGLLMIGTTLTGNVLATDHQDFKFVKRPFHYSVYLDPAEILDYAGSMKTVSIPFRIIEEPFEGYVMTREFNLNLEIAQRF